MIPATMKSQAQSPASVDIKELEAFALDELRHQRLRDNIIAGICERMDWDWNEGQHFLERVYADHRAELVGREKRLALILNLTIILDGLVVFAIGIVGIFGPLGRLFHDPQSGQFMIPAIDFRFISALLMLIFLAPGYSLIFSVITLAGTGIVVKGAIGMIRTIW